MVIKPFETWNESSDWPVHLRSYRQILCARGEIKVNSKTSARTRLSRSARRTSLSPRSCCARLRRCFPDTAQLFLFDREGVPIRTQPHSGDPALKMNRAKSLVMRGMWKPGRCSCSLARSSLARISYGKIDLINSVDDFLRVRCDTQFS